jgi:hypothetical protein
VKWNVVEKWKFASAGPIDHRDAVAVVFLPDELRQMAYSGQHLRDSKASAEAKAMSGGAERLFRGSPSH